MEALRKPEDGRSLPLDGREAAKVVEELLDYSPESGVFTWRERPGAASFNERYAGTRAGSPNQTGHLQVMIGGRAYLLHRLAWLITHRCWPEGILDHVNGDPADNRPGNLRAADYAQNAANSRKRSRNALGIKGVTRTRYGTFRAHISWRGQFRALGSFPTIEQAREARERAARELHGEFARGD